MYLLLRKYRQEHGRYPSIFNRSPVLEALAPSAPQQQPQQPAPQPQQRRSRRVWRAENAQSGAPQYTVQAGEGELSLGMGRKPSTEEYELHDVNTNTHSEPASGDTSEQNLERTPSRLRDSLPPYIPPPQSAVTVDRARRSSLPSARTNFESLPQ